jgi:hypothetical protein
MNCKQFESQIEQMEDRSLALSPEASQHASGCLHCTELKNDMAFILKMVQDLPLEAEPPARMWQNIEASLRAEGIIKPVLDISAAKSSRTRLFTFPNWAMATAAAVVILVGGVVYNVTHQNIVLNNPNNIGQTSKVVLDEEFDKAFLAEVEKTAPTMKPVYEKNLKNVNKFISDAKEAVDADPNDTEAVALLHDAQSQKALLVDVATSQSMR